MAQPIDVKCKGSKLIGNWANNMTLTFDRMHDLDHGFSWLNFEYGYISEMGGLVDIEQKWCESVIHVHDFDFLVTIRWGLRI